MSRGRPTWDEFLRKIEFEYESCLPEAGLKVKAKDGEVEIEEWIMGVPPYPDLHEKKKTPVAKTSTRVRLRDVLDPEGEHIKKSRVLTPHLNPMELLEMSAEELRDTVVCAAVAWLDYYGGSEERVEAICD